MKSDKQVAEAEKLVVQDNPFYLIDNSCLSIIDKHTSLKKLQLNETQKIVMHAIRKKIAERKPVRIWVLKARQEGCSTVIEAVIYCMTSQQENKKSLIMADQADKSTNLFNMTKLYHEMLEKDESHLAPELKKSNEKALEFEKIHSKILIESAVNVDATRSYTYNYVHLCMSGDTEILLKSGHLKNIKDVQANDKVITHLGRTAKVIGISKNRTVDVQGDNDLLSIKISGAHHFPIECTRGHKIYRRDKKIDFAEDGTKKQVCDNHGTKVKLARKTGRGEWVAAKDIKKGDMLGIPHRNFYHKERHSLNLPEKKLTMGKKWVKGKVECDANFGYFCGLYLAEGNIVYNKHKRLAAVQLSMHDKEANILEINGHAMSKYIKSHKIKSRENCKTTVCVYYGSSFAELISGLLGEKDSKHIPNSFWKYPKEFVLAFLKGYFEGDGYIPDDENIVYAHSVRPQMLFQIRDMLIGLRIGYSSIDKRPAGFLYGRNCREIYQIRCHGHTSTKLRKLMGWKHIENKGTQRRDWRLGRRHCWVKVDSVEKVRKDDVYDLILGHEDHSFRVASGVAVHNSECAFYPNLNGVMLGLNQSVPDLPGTMIIGETTANGRNEFYEEWQRAVQGKTDWVALFIPWFQLPEYSMPLESGQMYPISGIKFGRDITEEAFLQEEIDLQRTHNLSREQINWRRYAIVNKCGGDLDSFRQEYPATAMEAFVMSGKGYFDTKGLEHQEKILRTPKFGRIFKERLKYEFREMLDGEIRLYRDPVQGEEYSIAIDPSKGLPAGDEAAIVVMNRRTNETCACVSGLYPGENLAEMGLELGNYYNNAEILVENNGGYGDLVIRILEPLYGNLYKRKRRWKDKAGQLQETDEIGFNTNTVTRPQILAALNEELRNYTTNVYDKDLYYELTTFVQKTDRDGRPTKAEAARGAQDGLVMARAIAGVSRLERPYVRKMASNLHAKRRRYVHEARKHKNAGFGF